MKVNKKLYALLVLFIGPVLLVLLAGSTEFGRRLWEMDVNQIVDFYRSLGLWAVFISLGLNIIQTFIVFMPSVFLSGANAIVFGLFWGTLISWLGEVIGAALAFILYRYFGRSTMEELEQSREYLQKIDELSSRRGFGIVLLLRILPAMPSGLINLLAAVSKISFASFMLATALGKLPSLVLETLIGHDLFSWRENLPRLLVVTAIVAVGYGVYSLVRKKGITRRK